MSWHYQIFRTTTKYTEEQRKMFDIQETEYHSYGIKEYYPLDEDDEPGDKADWTADDITPHGDDKEELIRDLEMMLEDAKKMGVRDSETGELIDE